MSELTNKDARRVAACLALFGVACVSIGFGSFFGPPGIVVGLGVFIAAVGFGLDTVLEREAAEARRAAARDGIGRRADKPNNQGAQS